MQARDLRYNPAYTLRVKPANAQVAELCAAGGVPLDTRTNRGLADSLAAAERAAPDPATVSLVKNLATRAMSEAQYFSTGARPFTIDLKPNPNSQPYILTSTLNPSSSAHTLDPGRRRSVLDPASVSVSGIRRAMLKAQYVSQGPPT